MGQKQLIFCDLCKAETAEDQLSSLAFKKPGKTKANSFDICGNCSEKIQQQLVSNTKLEYWSFSPVTQTKTRSSAREIVDTEINDEDFVRSKRSQVKEITEDIPVIESAYGEQFINNEGKCRHVNKGLVTRGKIEVNGTVIDGFFRRCKDCKDPVPEPLRGDREGYMNATQNFKE